MKFRNLVFLVIVAVLIAAWYTKPDYDDFVDFREQQPSNLTSPPVIDYSDGFLYSHVTVTYFQPKELSVKIDGGAKAAVAVPVSKEKYIGLFGKFWQLSAE